MSWISDLYQTYENSLNQVAVPRQDHKEPLLPVSHTIARAHVEAELDGQANVTNMRMLSRDEADTILPCTEDSASRSSGIAPHALYDNLKYTAGDFDQYISGGGNEKHFLAYMQQLDLWCEDASCPDEVRVIRDYLKKRRLIRDLIDYNILITDDTGKVTNEWSGERENKPMDASKLMVRFRVSFDGKPPVRCNENKPLFQSYQSYYMAQKTERRTCYVTGEETVFTEKHPSRLRNGGDNAKLISSNDVVNFVSIGRFRSPSDAITVGYEVSQKAHHALRWLIRTQGWHNGEQVILAWGIAGHQYPSLRSDTHDLFNQPPAAVTGSYSTQEEFARQLRDAALGVGPAEGLERDNVVVLAVEAATPGRLSITYYQKLKGSDFLDNIVAWHSSCCWNHTYKSVPDGFDKNGKQVYRRQSFTGAPSPEDIVFAAYGGRADDKLKKNTIERLLPCIVEGKKLPKDLMQMAVRRASNPVAMEPWEWHKTFTIACALVRKYRQDEYKECWNMALDESNNERNYLFGRLLAYAEIIEERAEYYAGHAVRETNANKYRNAFVNHPRRTWGILDMRLNSYRTRLIQNSGRHDHYLIRGMNEIVSRLENDGLMDANKLDERYLLGYADQITEFWKKKEDDNIKEAE